MKKYQYHIVLKKSQEGYSIHCPELPGCWSWGNTEEKAIERITSAMGESLSAVTASLHGADEREIGVVL